MDREREARARQQVPAETSDAAYYARLDREREARPKQTIEDGEYYYKMLYQNQADVERDFEPASQARANTYAGIGRSSSPMFKPSIAEARFLGFIDNEPPKPAAPPVQIVGLQRQYFKD